MSKTANDFIKTKGLVILNFVGEDLMNNKPVWAANENWVRECYCTKYDLVNGKVYWYEGGYGVKPGHWQPIVLPLPPGTIFQKERAGK